MKNIKGIIFDMDGVLVKTIPIAKKIAKEKLQKYGIYLTNRDHEDLAGFSWKDFLQSIYKSRKIKPIKGLYEDILRTYSIILPKKVSLYNGAKELLDLLSSKYKLVLVSGSSKKDILSNLIKFNLSEYFEIILSSEEVRRGKPEPDLYLEACKQLLLTPRQCIAIEDSILGVQAVKNAKMLCIGITNTVSKDRLKKADIIVNSLSKISQAIKKISLNNDRYKNH